MLLRTEFPQFGLQLCVRLIWFRENVQKRAGMAILVGGPLGSLDSDS
jgi:hypothetical protein